MSGLAVSANLISGHIDTILLKVISENDCYGYSICKSISNITEGEYELKEATLYSGLRRLESDQLIVSYWGDETQGGRRKYYTITSKGRESLHGNIAQWEKTKSIIDRVLLWRASRGRGINDEQHQN